ncbi:MAG: cysteine desulfurase family protein [Candidatus Liptonbacteria bacterium]|nr:cysteine desulfurase family protein [Candidatus Liptonbacteria bacterium]
MEKIYLDYAASTPVDPRVFEAMRPYFTEKFGNPGSLHSFGQEAIAAVDKSRETIAKALGADFREVIFTGSATEANNLALRGVIKRFEYRISNIEYPRIIISAIEHESVLETARDLEREGIEVVYLPVDRRGVVDLEKLKEALNERTVLVSIMHANNEIGTAQPLFEIHRIIEDFKKRNSSIPQFLNCPLLHSDCAQAFQFLDCDVDALGVDLMTLSAHKIYGPKGIGALYVRQGKEKNVKLPDSRFQILDSIATGGGQEFGLRSGTENVPLIVGFAKAVELAIAVREKEARRIGDLRDRFWAELKKIAQKRS